MGGSGDILESHPGTVEDSDFVIVSASQFATGDDLSEFRINISVSEDYDVAGDEIVKRVKSIFDELYPEIKESQSSAS